jgi:hypothetical protein
LAERHCGLEKLSAGLQTVAQEAMVPGTCAAAYATVLVNAVRNRRRD